MTELSVSFGSFFKYQCEAREVLPVSNMEEVRKGLFLTKKIKEGISCNEEGCLYL